MKKASHKSKSSQKAAKPKKKKNVSLKNKKAIVGKLSLYEKAAKKIGWKDPGKLNKYPTSQAVTKAIKKDDIEQLMKWIRFLPNPADDREFDMWNKAAKAMEKFK